MDTLIYFSFAILLCFICVPLYLLGRLIFAISPLCIKFYRLESRTWYYTWSINRLIIVLVLITISALLSFFWGNKLFFSKTDSFDYFTRIILFFSLQIILLFLVEAKMEHPFKPLLAFKNFRNKIYEDRFAFKTKLNFNDQILEKANVLKNVISKSTIRINENLSNHNVHLSENCELLKENNKLHKKNYYGFEIRNYQTVDKVIELYQIADDSKDSVIKFFSREKFSKPIHFTAKPKNGVQIIEIVEFFQNHTNLIEKNKKDLTGRKYIVDIINELVTSVNKKGVKSKRPLNLKNIYKYL